MSLRPTSAALVVLASAAAAVAVTGCGGAHRSAAPLTAAQRAGAAALARSQSALDRISTLRISSVLTTTGGQKVATVARIALPGRIQATESRGGESSTLRLIGDEAYLHGNAAYWQADGAGSGAASLMAQHWFALPLSALQDTTSVAVLRSSATLGRCTLGLAGATVVVTARTATTLTLTQTAGSTTDTILLDRRTGLPRSNDRRGPNVTDPTCGVSASGTAIRGGTTRYDDYGAALSITAPAHPLGQARLQQLLGVIGRPSSSSSSTTTTAGGTG